ncbi:hypothetical protein AVEN_140139-1 [Araneus ventricosus]|uniref:GAG-pre-integrase domain-containing protein n=1 Tax=Araneus ventricosus TaxID=182803 RepID=A0A4Y2G010_ARAVE|nr:hypothetical protein AVEN_140139-1 [Araneus ventricosus]
MGHIRPKCFSKNGEYLRQERECCFNTTVHTNRNTKSEFRSLSTECWLKVNSEIILHGTRIVDGTLFKDDIEPIMPEKGVEVHTVMENSSLLQLYHERGGHQDKRHIKDMLQKELGISVHLDNKPCESRIYGKAHRLPYGTRKKVLVNWLQQIYVDLLISHFKRSVS